MNWSRIEHEKAQAWAMYLHSFVYRHNVIKYVQCVVATVESELV